MSQSTKNSVQLAIVSPCSSCKNQLIENKDYKTACPRRIVGARHKALEQAGQDSSFLNHLAVSGTDSADDLRNPVYWNEGNAILLWVATLADNQGVQDKDGNVLCPHILNPGFNTEYIQCQPLPVVPRGPEAGYFQNGSFQEGDHLEVSLSTMQQREKTGEDPVLIDGFAQKVHFAFFAPRKRVEKDHVPAGT